MPRVKTTQVLQIIGIGRVDKYPTRYGMSYCFRVYFGRVLATCCVVDALEGRVEEGLRALHKTGTILLEHSQSPANPLHRPLFQKAIIAVTGGKPGVIHTSFRKKKVKPAEAAPAVEAPPTVVVHADTARLNAAFDLVAKGEMSMAELYEAFQELLHGDLVEKPTPQSRARQAYHKALDDLTRPNKVA